MRLEDQICSLDLSKRLQELGIKQDGYFCWFKLSDKDSYDVTEYWQINDLDRFITISAYTVSELLDLLPTYIDIKRNEPFNFFWLNIQRRSSDNIKNIVSYECDSISGEEIDKKNFFSQSLYREHDHNLANALANMLIYLIENGYHQV